MAHDELAEHLSPANVSRLRQLLTPHVRRTPLLRCRMDLDARGQGEVSLKCENLQRTGSFKLRGALGALLGYRHHRPGVWRRIEQDGIVTGSTGNFAQGLAYATALLGLRCTIVVPSSAAPYKLEQVARYNPEATLLQVPYARWRETMVTGSFPGLPGYFLASETDAFVSLGNATLALEILEELPEVDALLVPFGGGNLAYSLASLVRQLKAGVRVYAVEVASGAPLSASLQRGQPVEVAYRGSFVDGIGSSFVIPAQFHRLKELLSGALTVTPEQIAEAVSFLALSEKLIAEGAGAAALAAARQYSGVYGWKNPCCIVSGGVIHPETLASVLRTPTAPNVSGRVVAPAA
ncbi:pyridoxal-phosphate dependent enzyme [Archangium sp.]|jgi:threonine dehydratase|uniref:pyridoxal-phosphate dependent enzyme n=1 Tax=Archangium sp. TaxID=1872627 RepID=UPI00389B0F90